MSVIADFKKMEVGKTFGTGLPAPSEGPPRLNFAQNERWIHSRVDLKGNEIADTLAKAGARELPEPSVPLTFLEIFSRTKHQNKTAWITPQGTIGINVLVLEALWLAVLQDRIKLF
ncbi:RNase H domain-containing protein [Trichonephila clavipes]|nr:RNase H domain-containing protein [Trichonephila clavipes]